MIRTSDLYQSTHHPSHQITATIENNIRSKIPRSSQLEHDNTLCQNSRILNITNLYKVIILNYGQNTRRGGEGRYHTPRFRNDYGRRTLAVSLPSIMNELPYFSIRNKSKRKKVFKIHLLNSQDT